MLHEFELLAGSYIDINGKEYRHDPKSPKPVIVRSEDRLDLQFANKFYLRGSEETTPPEDNFFQLQAPKPALPPPTQGGDFIIKEDHAELKQPPNPTPKVDRGTDVTEEYPQAALHGLRVFRRKGRLCLSHENNLNETVMAKGGYVGTAQLKKAIDKYTAEHANV